jgi:hypothetical protein
MHHFCMHALLSELSCSTGEVFNDDVTVYSTENVRIYNILVAGKDFRDGAVEPFE